MGIMTVIKSAAPNSYFFKGATVNFGVPWICLSVSMNILVTTLICTRILLVRHQVQASLGDNDMKLYTSIMAILVESSLPFSLLGVVFVVTYAMDLDISLAFANIWGVFAVSLIIFQYIEKCLIRVIKSETKPRHYRLSLLFSE